MKKIVLICILMVQSLVFAATVADTNSSNVQISGTLEAVYSSNYVATSPQANVQYFLKINKLKMVKLDMSRLSTQSWQGLVGKAVEIDVSKANALAIENRTQRAYVVLKITYKPSTKTSSTKAKALAVADTKKPWLNLLCKFADIATEPHPRSFYQTMFGNTYPYLEHYWKEITYGLIDISGTQTIDNWVTLPHDRSYYVHGGFDIDLGNLYSDCLNAAGTISNLDAYYKKNMFFNGSLGGYSWGGSATYIAAGHSASLSLVAHEMGHAYNLPHSSGRYGSDYDSPWDVMSDGRDWQSYYGVYYDIPSDTIAYYKQKLGAIDINAQWNNAEVDASSGELIHLSRLEENAIAGDYLIANIYSTDGTKHYTVEARDKIGYDSPLPAKAVIIHEIENNYRAYVVDPDNNGNLSDAGAQWQVGETFTDTANGISVEIVSTTETGYNIRITAARVKPATVTDITATDNLLDKVHIRWSSVQGAEYYKVLRYDSWSLDSNYTEFTTTNNDTFYDDIPTDLNTYYYRVKACNSQGCSELGNSYGTGKRVPLNIFEKSDSVTAEDFKYYTIDAFSGEKLNVVLSNLSVDIDLYVQIGSNPTRESFICKSTNGSTYQEECTITLNSDTSVHIGVYGYEAGSFTIDIGVTGELKDTDGDGMINHFDTDDDNDGISDTLEIVNGLNPLNISDAQTDLDHDGFSNAIEIQIGTDIRKASSKPIWVPIGMGDIVTFVPALP